MKQSLQLKIGQHLAMTPQLQQAIKLLQLSSLDLQQEIQQALYENPLLELAEEDDHGASASDDPQDSSDTSTTSVDSEDDWNNEIPNDLPVDANWDDIFQATAGLSGSNTPINGEGRDFDSVQTVTESLQDHLLWQLNLSHLSDRDRIIGSNIIDGIGEDGFLKLPINEIWQGLQSEVDEEDPVELDEVEAVLHRIQQFDPPGVGACSLRECLLIQLGQLPPDTPFLADARKLVNDHLDLIASRDYRQIERRTGMPTRDVESAVELIQRLSPCPGDAIQSSDIEYVVPDVRVSRKDECWQVSLNNDITPSIRINQSYAQLIRRADSSEQNRFLRDNLQEARTFLRSLESRNETLMRVATAIVESQQGFLEQGPEAMKPMVLADIADRLELHESTISRVTTQKYIDTPKGIYELKYFFSSHVSTASGGQCSSTAIRAMLKKMISEENPAKPLSDSKLATILEEKGIQVARRTVAKYRESLNIPSSSERKRYQRRQ